MHTPAITDQIFGNTASFNKIEKLSYTIYFPFSGNNSKNKWEKKNWKNSQMCGIWMTYKRSNEEKNLEVRTQRNKNIKY